MDLPRLFPWMGGTQLEVLVIFTCFFLLSTHAITAWCVKEEPFTDPCVIFVVKLLDTRLSFT
jgi:hypothetical protein